MKTRFLVFALALMLLVGCIEEDTGSEVIQEPVSPNNSVPGTEPPSETIDDLQPPPSGQEGSTPAENKEPIGLDMEIDDKELCPADVLLTYVGCKDVDDNTIEIEVINQYRDIVGLVYYLFDGTLDVGNTGLMDEKFANKERRTWSIDTAALEKKFGPWDKIEVTPVILIDGVYRACINKKLSLMPAKSCK